MKLLAAALMWTGTTLPAAWLYSHRFREPAAVLTLIGVIFTLIVLARKDGAE